MTTTTEPPRRKLMATAAQRAALAARTPAPAAPPAPAAKVVKPAPVAKAVVAETKPPTQAETAAAPKPKRKHHKHKPKPPPDPEVVRQVGDQLRERFPAVFGPPPRVPLAIGIDRQILDLVGDEIGKPALAEFLRWWVHRFDYLDAIAHGEPRRNLDGTPASTPGPAERAGAAKAVYGGHAPKFMARIEAALAERDA